MSYHGDLYQLKEREVSFLPQLLPLLTYRFYFVIEILAKKSRGKDREVIRSHTNQREQDTGWSTQTTQVQKGWSARKPIAFEWSTQDISVLYHNKRWYKMCWQTLIKPWCWSTCWQLNQTEGQMLSQWWSTVLFSSWSCLTTICILFFTFLKLRAAPPFDLI